jgi:uncharacterized protein (DUF1800 family)
MNWQRMIKTFTAGAAFTLLSAFSQSHLSAPEPKINLPYKKMGLTQEQAAAHLLGRFSFGATPGQVKAVANMGLEKWLEQQLEGKLPDDEVNKRLAGYDALALNNQTIVNTYLNAGQVIRVAAKNNLLDKDSIKSLDKPEYRQQVKQLMDQQGYKPQQELQRQLINQKIIRAAYGQNQLQEVLTDFWFNHFNVSLTKGQCAQFVMGYERDAIRPNVLGNFETMLEATAKHPAMLEYLDNASSVSNDNEMSKRQQNNAFRKAMLQRMETMGDDSMKPGAKILQQTLKARKTQGLNENYAREIMELHTLGVDGGYSQKDVTEVARALTGWSVTPLYKDGPGTKLMEAAGGANALTRRGYVVEGDFMFRADRHDENPKTILGKTFPPSGGYQEGMQVLHMLANHPSTAKFICTKLAARFVADTPSAVLVNKMADTYLKTGGNIRLYWSRW